VTPTEVYRADIKQRGFQEDKAQREAVFYTQVLYDELTARKAEKTSTSLFRFFKKEDTPPIKGLYFWGGVGRGKSYLIDTFHDCLPFTDKKRVHFNQFMQDIHNQLKDLPKTPDPLMIVSAKIADQCRVLCIDEFHVDDITDAMIMAGLLNGLFAAGMTIVATSNIAPEQLYKNGLQRDRFLPAIDLIVQHTNIYHLDNGVDYRLELLEKHGTFHVQDTADEDILQQHIHELANTEIIEHTQFELNRRIIHCRARADNQIWFSFAEICETPRSSADYIALATEFETILISDIPMMDDGKNDVAQRFIHLVDAFYDQRVKFIATAEAAPDELYTGKGLRFPFQRTSSRLHEMRSEAYLSHTHISQPAFAAITGNSQHEK